MATSDDWEQWYAAFAATWPPRVQALIDSKPDADFRRFLWRLTRQNIPVPQQAVDRFRHQAQDDMSWLVAALQDERRWFVARLVQIAGSVPEPLFEPMVISAAEAEDPSLNALLIKPCVQSFGAQRVKEYLVSLADSADPRRVVGATDAMYWTGHKAEGADLFERRKLFLLEACFSGTSTYVRDRILARLMRGGTQTMDESLFPESHRQWVARAQALWDEILCRARESRSC
jgi:hypothetical protein